MLLSKALLLESGLAHLFGFVCAESKLATFCEDLEGADPAAEVGVGSVDVGREAEPEFDLHFGDILQLQAGQL